mmetsp:Transcript_48537/g.96745  ORF Transcript_48537/g.96745 Transcript_48537/m.96745 type:complete len:116 (-) Transcript_48537:228-575(-)
MACASGLLPVYGCVGKAARRPRFCGGTSAWVTVGTKGNDDCSWGSHHVGMTDKLPDVINLFHIAEAINGDRVGDCAATEATVTKCVPLGMGSISSSPTHHYPMHSLSWLWITHLY